MTVDHVVQAMHSIAPLRYAESWDNVGLLIGSRSWSANRVMLTIDLTHEVMDEAVREKAEMILAYHPPIFEPLAALTDETVKQQIALRAASERIAVYSPHTALDAIPGGVNDWLADGLGAGEVCALQPHESVPSTEECKIVTFCPEEAVAPIRHGLARSGAGRINDYELCSFELRGTGTFLGGASTSPRVGRRGALERVDEIRLEMVCPWAARGEAIAALRAHHPYEEPPIEIYRLEPRPHRSTGAGRRVTLSAPVSLPDLVARIKTRLGVDQLRVATGRSAPRRYETIGLCAGAGGSLLGAAVSDGCRAFLTGEMRHHDVLDAQARGCTVILAGHTNTERGYLKTLRKTLTKAVEGVRVTVSKRDRDPLAVM